MAQWYDIRIGEISGIESPYINPTTTRMSWFVYVVRCRDSAHRTVVMQYLQDHGIPSRPYFSPIHLQPFYRERFGYQQGELPNTERAGETCLALPFSSIMTENQVDHVCQHLRIAVNARVYTT